MSHVIGLLKKAGMPVTRDNYIGLNYGDDIPDPWTPAHESELPEELQDWTRFEMRGETMVLKPGATATSPLPQPGD